MLNSLHYLRSFRDFCLIKYSQLFNKTYYLSAYPQLQKSRFHSLLHFIRTGWQEGKNPSPEFDTTYYLNQNPDVKSSGINPLVHYILWGRDEGRLPKPGHVNLYPRRYAQWIRRNDQLTRRDKRLIRRRINSFTHRPNITIFIRIELSKSDLIDAAVASLKNQLYPNWNALLVIDQYIHPELNSAKLNDNYNEPRIKVVSISDNAEFSQIINHHLNNEKSDFFGVLDITTRLRPHSLYLMTEYINQNPEAVILYCDEDKIDCNGRRFNPCFKPDWNPDLFLTKYYFGNLCFYQTGAAIQSNGFKHGFGSLATWEFALRLSESIHPKQIIHLPFILCHKLYVYGQDAVNNGRLTEIINYERLIQEHFQRAEQSVKVIEQNNGKFRIKHALPKIKPLISIIVATKNQHNLLIKCINSIITKSSYKVFEIIIIDNNSDEPDAIAYLEHLNKHENIRVISYKKPFNYSAINNVAAEDANGEVLIFLNNDTEIINEGCLEELASQAMRPEIGAVGALLLYPNGTVQHAGIILNNNDIVGIVYYKKPKWLLENDHRAHDNQNYSAVAGACLAIRKKLFREIGGFNEENLPITHNDIDLCLRLMKLGYRNLWSPYARLYHYESASRGYEDTPEKKMRYENESDFVRTHYHEILLNDPAYNPNLSNDHILFIVDAKTHTKKPWC